MEAILDALLKCGAVQKRLIVVELGEIQLNKTLKNILVRELELQFLLMQLTKDQPMDLP